VDERVTARVGQFGASYNPGKFPLPTSTLDCRGMRPVAFLDPGAFTGTDLGLLRLVRLRGLLFPDARRLEHPSHWKNTLP
jgi:hypothetical protein